jgi:hypothetical protein
MEWTKGKEVRETMKGMKEEELQKLEGLSAGGIWSKSLD